MSKAVTWEYLNAEQVHRCLSAADKQQLVAAIYDANQQNNGNLFSSSSLATAVAEGVKTTSSLKQEQEKVLLDMYIHLIRFAQGMGFNPEKVSTLVGIVAQSHQANVATRATNLQAYKDFEARLVAHSVHRPPFSAQVFSLVDGKAITDYMLNSYFRHYKLYQYAFTPKQTAEVKTVVFATPHNVPPHHIVSMVKAIPMAQWEASQEELRVAEEERQAKIAAEEAAAAAEADRIAQEARRPQMTAGLRQQLDMIKSTVSKMSNDKLDELETKLAALEGRMSEVNKPMSAGVKGPTKPPSKK
jgi:hypothetical protein